MADQGKDAPDPGCGGAERPPERGLPRWVGRLLEACLGAWPADRRRAVGASLQETAETVLSEAARRGRPAFLREVAGEAAALVGEGLAMRAAELGRAGATGAARWSNDLRLALRTLLRTPAFTLVVVSTLALGIGANAAVFSLVQGVLLAEPPYAQPDKLLLVWNTLPGSRERIPVAAPDAAALRDRAELLAGVAFMLRTVDGAIEAAEGDAAEHVRLTEVTPDFFAVLGVEPAVGRDFGAWQEPGAPSGSTRPVILAHGTWRRFFGADPAVVGRTVRVNGSPVEVVGVMPAGFRLLLPPDAGVGADVDVWGVLLDPLETLHRSEGLLDQDSDNSGVVLARLTPGAPPAAAREEVRGIGERLQDEVPSYAAAGLGMDARPLRAEATAHARSVLLALGAGAVLVLLAACLNVSGLLLARGANRSGELALRSALGAGRAGILRQLVAESLVLVGLGLVAALALARAAALALTRLVPAGLAPADGPALDPRTLAFAVLAASVAVVLAGLLPARRVASLEAWGRVGPAIGRWDRAPGRVRRVLVVSEVALSVVLVLGAGLLLRTVAALQDVSPGFEPRGALTFHVSLRVPERYRGPAQRAELMKALEARLAELPGVRAVGWVGGLPLSGERWTQPWGLPGQPLEAWESNRADFRVASSGYFQALGARLLEGRSFTAREDLNEDERVVVVDRTLARRIAPAGSALDAVIGVPVDGAPVEARVVGVVEPIRYEGLDVEGREAIYVPYRQEASRQVAVVVRTVGDPEDLAPAVRAAVRELDPQIPVYGLRTMEAYVAEAVAPRRFALGLMALFAALGLACSALGLYGIVAFDVSRRTREIGVRMALGASPARTTRGVLASGLRLAGAGLAVGVLLALVVAGGLRSLVYGVGVADPAAWLGVVVLVAGVTLLACWLPARRASRLDPLEALRRE